MDAVKTTLTKTALLLALALLFLTPWSAQAQSITTCGSVTFSGLFAQCDVYSTGAAIPFTASVGNYSDSGYLNWLSVTPSSGNITASGLTLTISLTNTSLNPSVDHTATITLTPTSGPASAVTIPVTFHPSSGAGGGGSGIITLNTSSLTFCPTNVCFNPQYVILSTTSLNAVPFTISAPSWMTATQITGTSGSVSSGNPAQISLLVNNFSSATSPASVTFNYAGGPTSVSINIAGSGGSGTLSLNPSTVTWSYATGGQQPATTPIAISTNSGAANWTAQATSDGNWLLLFYNSAVTTDIYNIPFSSSSSFSVYPGTNIQSLSSGTHTGQVTVTDSNGNSTTLTVSLTVNGSSTNNGLTVNPGTITLPSVSAGSSSVVSNSASITSTNGGNLSYTTSGQCPGISASFNVNSMSAFQTGVVFTVFGSPSGVLAGTYNSCTLTVNLANGTSTASVAVPVTWIVGAGSGGGGTSNPVSPTSLNFPAQSGSPVTPPSQSVAIAATGAWTAAISYNSTPTGWITADASGNGPGSANVSVNPAGLGVGTYTATITYSISTTGGTLTQAVTVTLSVYSNAVIYANPGSISIQGADGTIIGATQFQLLASDGTHIPFNASTSTPWLTLFSAASDTTPTFASYQVNLSNLANGVYAGSIDISAPTAANSTLSVPIVLTVSGSSTVGGGSLTFSSSSLTFSPTTSNPQTLTVTAPAGVTYTVSASGTANGVNWLTISPSGFISTSSQNIQVTANQGSLQPGTYSGTISFTTNSSFTQNVGVTLLVSSGSTTSAVTSAPASLTFNANQNGSAPASQTLSITSASGSAGINYDLTTTVSSGSTHWLTATASGYTTPSTITVNASQSGLQPGTYTGAVVVSPFGNGATPLSIPVTFVVAGLPGVSASPTSLNLAYSAGGTPPTATVNVSGTASDGTGLNYTASVSSTCNCMAISPSSGTTTANPAITVSLTNATTLTAASYTGTITVSGTNGSTGSTTINVTLTVTAPLPTITAVLSTATGLAGPLSPGEIVSIYANITNPIGPSTPVQLSSSNLTQSGNVPTTMGGVTVTFNGRPAALLYVSATQINAVVPYGVAGFTNFPVFVNYLGQSSNGFNVQTTTTAPGIFTQNGQGTGPAAVLNSNGSVNGNTPTTQPAAKGSVITIYLTGEGATSPAGVDGQVTCGITGTGCSSLSQIPVPLLRLAVLIDGQPAALATAPGWVGYGEAPGLVSGVLQINAIVPAGARSGTVSLSVSIGGNTSQSNVTIAVQ